MCSWHDRPERKGNPRVCQDTVFRVISTVDVEGQTFEGEWRAVKGSRYFESFDLYKENGFQKREKAEELIAYLSQPLPLTCEILSIEKKKEKKIRAVVQLGRASK